MNVQRTVIIASVAIIAFGTVAVATFKYVDPKDPATVDLLDTRVCALGTSAKDCHSPSFVPVDPDGMVRVMVYTSSIRREMCPAVIYRTFADDAGNVIYRVMQAGGKVPVSKDDKPVEFPMPFELSSAKFPLGKYTYHTVSFSRCVYADGRIRNSVATTNMATFTVK